MGEIEDGVNRVKRELERINCDNILINNKECNIVSDSDLMLLRDHQLIVRGPISESEKLKNIIDN